VIINIKAKTFEEFIKKYKVNQLLYCEAYERIDDAIA
jgi:predicted GIY-YIG superfamily endonuclease